MAMKLLGIDMGTGGTRALLLDGEGRVVSSATAAHPPFASPHTGWAEQNPDDGWSVVCSAVPECLARGNTAAGEISELALTGRMHGLVLPDRDGSVLRPSIL
jgi:xylulokinase